MGTQAVHPESKTTLPLAGRNATLHANVLVRELDVQGTLQGNVEASDKIEIRKDAKLVGQHRPVEAGILAGRPILQTRKETRDG